MKNVPVAVVDPGFIRLGERQAQGGGINFF